MKYSPVWFAICICILLMMRNTAAAAAHEGDNDNDNGDDSSSFIISSLPGFPAHTLPFTLETGYIGIRENEEVQLFYYFIPSEKSPQRDPLLLWLIGGPGCSAFSALVYENGPLAFDFSNYDGSLPSFTLNPYSWTKVANIIFLDYVPGAGFSYATTSQGYIWSDTQMPKDINTFFRKWLLNHPAYQNNVVYIGGDSYGGKITTMASVEIVKGNEVGLEPQIKLRGYVTGNSMIDTHDFLNEQLPYANRMALIPDKYFQMAKSSCDGEYVNPDPNNVQCNYAIQLFKECIRVINPAHVLEPFCRRLALTKNHFMADDHSLLLDLPSLSDQNRNQNHPFCREQNYWLSYVWANNKTVQEALHIRMGTVKEWKRCNTSVPYESDIPNVLENHQFLIDKGFRVLVYRCCESISFSFTNNNLGFSYIMNLHYYSGDHDLYVPYTYTMKWIQRLNISLEEQWRPWTVDGQVAGYTETYSKKNAYLTFATVKGGGHTAIEYKPKECLAMFSRWLTSYII